jgi:hypothetical protein
VYLDFRHENEEWKGVFHFGVHISQMCSLQFFLPHSFVTDKSILLTEIINN